MSHVQCVCDPVRQEHMQCSVERHQRAKPVQKVSIFTQQFKPDVSWGACETLSMTRVKERYVHVVCVSNRCQSTPYRLCA